MCVPQTSRASKTKTKSYSKCKHYSEGAVQNSRRLSSRAGADTGWVNDFDRRGGDEKKAKIGGMLPKAVLPGESWTLQGTQDATKWNECMSPQGLALLCLVMFAKIERKKANQEEPNKVEKVFLYISLFAFYYLARKRVLMGEGPAAFGNKTTCRLKWINEDLLKMNTETQAKFRQVEDKIEGQYIVAMTGMLMGMFNAASTTYALVAVNHPVLHP